MAFWLGEIQFQQHYKKNMIREVSVLVGPEDEPIFSERMFRISVEDEDGGEFLVLSNNDGVEIRMDPDEVEELTEALNLMAKRCRGVEINA